MRAIAIVRQHFAEIRELAAATRDLTLVHEIDSRIEQLSQRLELGEAIPGLTIRDRGETDENPIELIEVAQAAVDRKQAAREELRETLRKQVSQFDGVIPATLAGKPTAGVLDRSLRNVVKRFIAHKQVLTQRKAENGKPELSTGRFAEIKAHMDKFVAFVGADSDIDKVNRSTVLTSYREHLDKELAKDSIAQATAKNRMGAVKQFLRWCQEEQIVEGLPPNISSRSLYVTVEHREPEKVDLGLFKKVLGKSPDRTKLWLLLAANCGFRQSDIADLRLREVDLATGRVSHARVKTAKKKPPTVNYLLWPETLRLLREHFDTQERSMKADSLVFVNANGQPIVTRTVDEEGKLRITDNIKNAVDRVLDAMELPRSERLTMGRLRTTSADLLRKEYSQEIQTLFLGNKPGDMASRHYTTTHDDYRLDEPLKWLSVQYGFASEAKPKPKRKTKRKAT